MRIKIKLDSAAASAKLRKWGGELREKVRKAVGTAMRAEAPAIKAEVQSHVANKLKVVRRSFPRSFTAKVIDRDTRRLPALHIGARIPWIGIHESGGTVQGKLLIPLYGRVGRKAFKAHVTALMRGGNAVAALFGVSGESVGTEDWWAEHPTAQTVRVGLVRTDAGWCGNTRRSDCW
jgi:hypothetical protein